MTFVHSSFIHNNLAKLKTKCSSLQTAKQIAVYFYNRILRNKREHITDIQNNMDHPQHCAKQNMSDTRAHTLYNIYLKLHKSPITYSHGKQISS